MSERMKLPNPGDTLIMKVATAGKATTGKYPGIDFGGTMADNRQVLLEVPVGAVERQLTRQGLVLTDCLGRWVTFHRSPNPTDITKAFWDLTVNLESPVTANRTAAPPPPVAADLPPWADAPPPDDRDAPPNATTGQPRAKAIAEKTRTESLFEAYEECFAHACGIATEYKITDQRAIAAMASTLYIALIR